MDINQIIANTADGVLVLGRDGRIGYANAALCGILGVTLSPQDKYLSLMNRSPDPRNDAFHQVILDAIYQQGTLVRQQTSYYQADGQRIEVQIRAKVHEDSVVFTLTDVTELEQARRQQQEAALITAVTICFLAGWVYFTRVWSLYIDSGTANSYLQTHFMLLFGAVLAGVFIRYTSLSVRNMGLQVQDPRTLLWDALLAAGFVALACGAKLILRRIVPGMFPYEAFFYWEVLNHPSIRLYFLSVFGQELLARGCLHEALKIVFQGPHQKTYALLVSSVLFGALHLHKSFPYMVVTPLFMYACGLLYEKQKNIWGICILHYVLLITCKVLAFF